MISTQVSEIGSSTSVMAGAILLYKGQTKTKDSMYGSGKFNFASVHSVELINGAPQVSTGRPITAADLQTLAKELSEADQSAIATRWIDPSILATGPDRMVWWTPPRKRALYFKQSTVDSSTFDGSAVCANPGLVWVAFPGKALYVYAVKGQGRPNRDTKLYQAPYFNVWGRGQVCVGNAVPPSADVHWQPEAWENFFFGSHFTHPNFSEKGRLVKRQNPVNFWKRMVANPPDQFPEAALVNVPLDVNDLMAPRFFDLLHARIAKPKGEF